MSQDGRFKRQWMAIWRCRPISWVKFIMLTVLLITCVQLLFILKQSNLSPNLLKTTERSIIGHQHRNPDKSKSGEFHTRVSNDMVNHQGQLRGNDLTGDFGSKSIVDLPPVEEREVEKEDEDHGEEEIDPQGFPHRYLINEPNACNENIKIINIVPVAPYRLETRLMIRDLWGDQMYTDVTGMRTLFLLGTTGSNKTQANVDTESKIFHDVLQLDIIDSYENLTLKTLGILHWVKNFCPSVPWVLKSDDDVFVNPFTLAKFVDEKHETVDFACLFHKTAKVCRTPTKHCPSKWVLPPEIYPNDTYPPYCGGGGYVINSRIISPLFDGADKTNPFILEDVYVTGIVAEPLKPQYFHLSNKKFPFTKSHLRKIKKESALMILNYETRKGDSYKLWNKVLNANHQPYPKKPRGYTEFGSLNKRIRARKSRKNSAVQNNLDFYLILISVVFYCALS